jgi:rhomboid family protein
MHARSSTAAPRQAAPVATYLLITAQVLVWLVVRRYLLTGDQWTDFALFPGAPSELGMLISPFVHLDPAHLGINLAVLWLFGVNLERAVGSLYFLFLYLGAGWFASLMQWAVATSFHLIPDLTGRDAAIGSSGAVAGILGASIVRFPQSRLRIPLSTRATFPTILIILLWLAYTVVRALITTVHGVTEGVGHWAHFAGFVFGLGLAQLGGLQRVARQEYLEHAAEDAMARHNLPAASLAWSALLAMQPLDLHARTALIAARLELNDLRGARHLARTGVEALVRAGERSLAMQAYCEYSHLLPELDLGPGIRYRIGCWLAEAGEDEWAFRALWESVREDGATPAAASALYRAGLLAWERLRSPLHAREAWERLLEQFPDSPWTEAARDALRHLPTPG